MVLPVGVAVHVVPPTPNAFLVLTPRDAEGGLPAAMAGRVDVVVGMVAVVGATRSTVFVQPRRGEATRTPRTVVNVNVIVGSSSCAERIFSWRVTHSPTVVRKLLMYGQYALAGSTIWINITILWLTRSNFPRPCTHHARPLRQAS